MATKFDGEENACIFQWKIENISHCWWLKKSDEIESPTFIADGLGGTKWSLSLYPMGFTGASTNYIGFYLNRGKDCNEPNDFVVKFKLSILGKDCKSLKEGEVLHSFKKNGHSGFENFETREKVFFTGRKKFLYEDSLTMQCAIWSPETTLLKPKHLYARTIFKLNRRYFDWKIVESNSRSHYMTKKFKNGLTHFDVFLNSSFDRLHIDISFDDSIKYISCGTSITDSVGESRKWGTCEYLPSDLKTGALSAVLSLPEMCISRYLLNDALLSIEIVLSTVEYFVCSKNFAESENKPYVGKEKYLDTSYLVQDLKSLYNDAILSDTEIRASTKTFPCHKGILSARSPVFKRMFSHDMQEKKSGHVEITDFDDDTIQRMLLYMYTDSLEDLQFESLNKLYKIADKYEMASLKSRCCSFLKKNLCPTNTCSVLVLADEHRDDELKSAARDYIIGQCQQFFLSLEWTDFMKSRQELALDVMYKRIFQK